MKKDKLSINAKRYFKTAPPLRGLRQRPHKPGSPILIWKYCAKQNDEVGIEEIENRRKGKRVAMDKDRMA